MLELVFVNDKTGNEDIGNYDYEVRLNRKILEAGKIQNHQRADGWSALVRQLIEGVDVDIEFGDEGK